MSTGVIFILATGGSLILAQRVNFDLAHGVNARWIFQQSILDVKERMAKSYIKFMREQEIILKDPSNASYFIVGHI